MLRNADPARILQPYVHRADELQRYEPLVAYHCRLYAMNRLLKLPKREQTESTDELVASLMKQLEEDKKSIQLSSDDGRYVEGFATKLFMKADKQEIHGKANLNTAKTFYASSLFFEILHNFGDFPFDVEQKQKYAAWKAAEIRKALKKNRKPLRVPPASEKASSVSDGRVVNSESPSANIAAFPQDQSSPSKQSTAIQLEIDAELDQVSVSTNQSCESLINPPSSRDIQSVGIISTSICHEQGSSDDDSFQSCSEEPDNDVLFPSKTFGSELDETIHTSAADVEGQEYEPSVAKIAKNLMRFSSRWFERAFRTLSVDQGQHDHSSATEIEDRDRLLSNDLGSSLDQFTPLQEDTGSILDSKTPLRNNSDSRLDRTISLPTNVQEKLYEPSAAEIVKAIKVSKLAVSALSLDDIPSAESYLKQALDLLTIPPTNSVI